MSDFINRMAELHQMAAAEAKENENALKRVSNAISRMDCAQPEECLFYGGCCGYPIDACYECPRHAWIV